MKKREFKNLQLNKKSISNLEMTEIVGATGRACHAESIIICEEGKTETKCLFNSNCIC
ncbi:hypothetical protein [Kordia sp.]|uniref:hypothetical protein n=1 Tax=Kordia sp. TaxID=1965332 RepID=UPI0025C458E8|nr:hypothetical protein [Kordia sp.]MCH2194779.1 hypothetical protein [Kordia sp.]